MTCITERATSTGAPACPLFRESRWCSKSKTSSSALPFASPAPPRFSPLLIPECTLSSWMLQKSPVSRAAPWDFGCSDGIQIVRKNRKESIMTTQKMTKAQYAKLMKSVDTTKCIPVYFDGVDHGIITDIKFNAWEVKDTDGNPTGKFHHIVQFHTGQSMIVPARAVTSFDLYAGMCVSMVWTRIPGTTQNILNITEEDVNDILE